MDCDDPHQGKYLTAAEMVEIINVAKQYNIEIVPSFNTPGHSEYMTYRYEEYTTQNGQFTFQYDGVTYQSGTDIYHNGGSQTKYGCIALDSDTARAFVLSMIEDYADFFQQYAGSDTFHIGADEIVFSNSTYNFVAGWDTYAVNKGFGTTAYDTFYQYLNTVSALLKSKGYGVRAFNDFLELDDMTHTVQLDPDIDIVYWSTDSNDHGMATAQEFVDQGRKVYNGIQSYCYYVLRVTSDGLDARDPSHDKWKFTKATGYNIWHWWDPGLFAQYGDNNVWVEKNQVAGAYYMIWCDYAGYRTEGEMWYGSTADWTADPAQGYAIRPRMWACVGKMWNVDGDVFPDQESTDTALLYSDYYNLCTTLADYPGYKGSGGCSAAITLPVAGEPVQLHVASHDALKELLAQKLSAEPYTEESYAVYDAAWSAAYAVDQDLNATEEEIDAAAAAVNDAIAGLVLRSVTVTVSFKTMQGSTEKTLGEPVVQTLQWGDAYAVPVPAYTNYSVSGVSGGVYADGTVCGTVEQVEVAVTVWYDCQLDFETLENALADAPARQGSYSDESWSAYRAEYDRIQAFYTTALEDATVITQDQLDTAVQELQIAAGKLVYGAVRLTFRYLTSVGGETCVISEDVFDWPGMTTYTFPVKHLKNYNFSHATGAAVEFTDHGANVGTISGLLEEETVIELWYDNAPSVAELSGCLADAPDQQGSYTDASWEAYQTVLMEVRSYYDSIAAAPEQTARQEQIDAQTAALRAAISALVVDYDAQTQITDATPISATVLRGRQAVISVVTTADVSAITVTCGGEQVTLERSTARLVQDSDGNVEKRWMVYFYIDESGEAGAYTYTIHAGEAAQDVVITCQ